MSKRYKITWTEIVAVVAVLAFAAGVRLWHMQDESMWGDEWASYKYLHAPDLQTFLTQERGEDPAMVPLYFVLEYYWARTVGDSVYAVRMLSVLFGVATVLMVYVLGRSLLDRTAGLVAALILAMLRPHIYFSQEIRMYALVWLLAVTSMWLLHMTLYGKRATLWFALHNLANLLLLWTHAFGAWLIIAQGLFLIVFHRRHRLFLASWCVCQLVYAASAGIWLSSVDHTNIDKRLSWIPQPQIETGLRELFLNFGMAKIDATHTAVSIFLLGVIVCLGFIAYRKTEPAAGNRPPMTEAYTLLIGWMLLPTIMLGIVSLAFRPCFLERYSEHKLSAVCLLLRAAVSSCWKRNRFAGAAVAALILGIYAHQLSLLERPFRANVEAAATLLSSQCRLGDRVVLTENWCTELLIQHYNLPKRMLREVASAEDACKTAKMWCSPSRRIWVLALRHGFYTPGGPTESPLAALPPDQFKVQSFPMSGPQDVYLIESLRPSRSHFMDEVQKRRAERLRIMHGDAE